MFYVGTKATVASQNAEARDVGCGSSAADTPIKELSQCFGFPSESRPGLCSCVGGQLGASN
jgi:hypothetical protein